LNITFHVCFERKLVEVQNFRERDLVVQLLVLEGLVVESDPLEMYDENVGHVAEHDSLLERDFLTARVTVVVFDRLTIKHLPEAIKDTCLVSDFQRERVERLYAVLGEAAAHASALGHCFALEDVLHEVLLACWLELMFHSVKEVVKELLCVHLHRHICWLAHVVLEGIAELSWVSCLSLREFEEAKELLNLLEHVVIDLALSVFDDILWDLVDSLEELVSKLRHHVELLKHRDHVANHAQVVDASL